jgi:putative flippase GtrA
LKGTLGLRHSFARYIVSGVGTTVLDYGLLYLLLRLRIQRDLSVSIAFGVSLVANFLLHKHYTFGRRNALKTAEIWRFLIAVAVNYASTLTIVYVCAAKIGWPVMVGKLISTPVIVMTGFLITRHFVFAPDPLRRREDHAAGI